MELLETITFQLRGRAEFFHYQSLNLKYHSVSQSNTEFHGVNQQYLCSIPINEQVLTINFSFHAERPFVP